MSWMSTCQSVSMTLASQPSVITFRMFQFWSWISIFLTPTSISSCQPKSPVALSGPAPQISQLIYMWLSNPQRVRCPHLPFLSSRGEFWRVNRQAERWTVIQIQSSDCSLTISSGTASCFHLSAWILQSLSSLSCLNMHLLNNKFLLSSAEVSTPTTASCFTLSAVMTHCSDACWSAEHGEQDAGCCPPLWGLKLWWMWCPLLGLLSGHCLYIFMCSAPMHCIFILDFLCSICALFLLSVNLCATLMQLK